MWHEASTVPPPEPVIALRATVSGPKGRKNTGATFPIELLIAASSARLFSFAGSDEGTVHVESREGPE